MSWVCPYNRCDGSGFVYDEAANVATDCPCRPQLIASTRAARLRARIPKRFANVSFDTPPVTDMAGPVVRGVRRYVDALAQNLDAGEGLWFEGPQGTGKTTLAMLVSKHALALGRSVAIYSVPRILSELRDTFDDDAEFSGLELIDRLTEVELLQLDDLGAERTSPWVLEQLYSVVNARYEAERSILITTNLGREELIDQVGARTVSRLEEMCTSIPVHGEDHRSKVGGFPAPAAPPRPAAPAYEAPTPRQGQPDPAWHSPASAANLERPSWERSGLASDDGGAPAAADAPPSWWDRRDPWPPRPEQAEPADPTAGLQGSARRGARDA